MAFTVDQAEIDRRFDYHAPDDLKVAQHQMVRDSAKNMAKLFTDLLPESREKSLAFTALEEVVFWANAAIARN
jgi:hypothetical protein